ncbi:hypothetical protein [Candidatus Soleaferrea massiliensis]|uniref:hypothetical protein n=1 Tax=Candidatus Soleaferrea massiliensis TaxID=1470354 RepID=UPI00058D5405|nr:hypothetical protein [Candidatus Soleaferrea massiliensis]
MQYKDYQFPHNPHRIQLYCGKQVQNTFSPILGDVVRVLGRRARTVKGEGVFFGKDRQEQFDGLYAVYAEQTPGSLQLPGLRPFSAFFIELELLCESGPQVLSYRFTFLEDIGLLTSASGGEVI